MSVTWRHNEIIKAGDASLWIDEAGPLGVNMVLLWDTTTGEAALIDPAGDIPEVASLISREKLKLSKILLTHSHFDHVWDLDQGAALLEYGSGSSDSTGVFLHAMDRPVFERLAQQGMAFGFRISPPHTGIDHYIEDSETISIGQVNLHVLHTPGHSPGSVSYYCDTGFVFTGDTLFQLGIGRSDLPGGNGRQLLESIQVRLFSLPDETVVVPGHGDFSTIGDEKRYNPYLQR